MLQDLLLLKFHTTPRGHTLKLIKDIVTRGNSTYYMLTCCIFLAAPLHKSIEGLGLEGPTDWSAAQLLEISGCHRLSSIKGEKYPTLGRKLPQLILYLSRPNHLNHRA